MTDEKIHFIPRIWRKIVEPVHEFEDPEKRWRVEMVNGIILTVTILSILFMVFFSAVNYRDIKWLEIGFFSSTFVIIVIPLILNKWGFTKIAMYSSIAIFTISISCLALLFRHPSQGIQLFMFLFIPIFIAQVMMKPLWAMLVSSGLILEQTILPILLYGSKYLMITLTMTSYLILLAFLIHLYVLYRERQEIRSRASLMDNEEKFRAIFDYSKDGIAVADPFSLRIITFNNAFRKMTGFSEKELLNMTIPQFHPPDIGKLLEVDISDMRQFKGKASKNYAMLKKDGSIFYVDMRTTRIKYGDETYMMGVFRDTTVERNLEHQKDMRRRETEFFLDLFEHDIGNIHQSALLSMQLAKMKKGEDKDLYIERSMRSMNRALLLVRNVKEMKKMHDKDVVTQDMNIVKILDQSIQDVMHLHPEKVARIIFESDISSIMVRANSFLVDVFINILDNAIKFSRDGSSIIEVKIDNRREKKVVVEIWDNGPGIPKEQREMIFQRYTERLMKEVKGTGLGLSICREIISGLKGRIWVETRPNEERGSVFKVELERPS
jgi:PAS domain S-box-containing protein